MGERNEMKDKNIYKYGDDADEVQMNANNFSWLGRKVLKSSNSITKSHEKEEEFFFFEQNEKTSEGCGHRWMFCALHLVMVAIHETSPPRTHITNRHVIV